MSLRELYQEMIIDHGRHPRNFGCLENATHQQIGKNPLCGDELIVYLVEENKIIKNIGFTGTGCAIAMASASLMTEAIKDKSVEQAKYLFTAFHDLMISGNFSEETLGKLSVFQGVREYPVRVKCAALAWHTLNALLHENKNIVSTE